MGFSNKHNISDPKIIIGRVGALCGNIHLSFGKRYITDNALIYSCNSKVDITFLAFAMDGANLNSLNTSSAQPMITGTKVMNTKFPVPPLSEQRAIVSFLDTELGKIDTYVDKEQQLIERLKELKQSVIARAVTRGINPNVRMKPSGVNWIGEIPEYWEEKRLSQVATEYFVSNKMVHHQNLLSLSYGKIVRKNINTTEGLLPASFDNYQVVDDGIIVLRLTDLQNDHKSLRVGLAHEEGIVTSAYLSIKPRENITSEYLYEQLHCNDLHKVFYGMGDGLRQSLNWQGLKNLPIVVPPLTEQRAIVDYISSATSKIDKLISEKTKEMEYMKELRQRIISDAVTGKIDVRS